MGPETELLERNVRGDVSAFSDPCRELFSQAYPDLYDIASRYLSRERANHTLQATGLVHEAFVRLTHDKKIQWQNQAQLVGYAARSMRQILVNYAKARNAEKRQRTSPPTLLEKSLSFCVDRALDLIELDEALKTLSQLEPRLVQVIELRFFGGLTTKEVAAVLGTSPRTVDRDWGTVRAWLHRKLRG